MPHPSPGQAAKACTTPSHFRKAGSRQNRLCRTEKRTPAGLAAPRRTWLALVFKPRGGQKTVLAGTIPIKPADDQICLIGPSKAP